MYFEVENVDIMKKCTMKEISYFRCCSHRLHNSPDSFFIGRVRNFDPNNEHGEIEIIKFKDHSVTCKFRPGNDTLLI